MTARFLEERNASFLQSIAGCPFVRRGYLFKQGSFYGAQATPDKTLHDLLTAPEARIIDEAKRYKSTLARAICNPFWDDAPQQDLNAHYLADEADVSGSSVAEATVRAVCLLSFIRSLYEKHPVVVTKDGVAIPVGEYMEGAAFVCHLV